MNKTEQAVVRIVVKCIRLAKEGAKEAGVGREFAPIMAAAILKHALNEEEFMASLLKE